MKLNRSDPDLETIFTRINSGELDLQPSFQRGEVWDLKRQQRLIDTVLRGWYVPAVHFVIDTDGNELVLDGQQRLTTVREFFLDHIKIDGNIQPLDPYIQDLHGLHYSELPDNVRRSLNRFSLQTITLTEYRPQEPNELFFRLNQSYNLTPPEKRNALHGRARDQVKDLVKKMTSEGLLRREVIGFANGRLAYDDILARACVSIEMGDMHRHINNNVVEKYYRDSEFSDETIERVYTAGLELLKQIQSTPDEKVRFNKGTLQTWIVYCDWASGVSSLPTTLLADFERDRASVKRGELSIGRSELSPITEILRIYDDRASYRVTDVSSVLARDLAIHLYSLEKFGTPERDGSAALLISLRNAPPEARQSEFFVYIDRSHWGNRLAGEAR